MQIFLTYWKTIAAIIALGGLVWFHMHLTANAVEAAQARTERAMNERFRNKERERVLAAQAHHKRVAALTMKNRSLQEQINVKNDPNCAWDNHFISLLNKARGYEPKPAGQSDDALPPLARTIRASAASSGTERRHSRLRRL